MSGNAELKKEAIEWLRIWCADTENALPRVALIGDSITENSNEVVKRELEGIAKVDYLATSYAITSPAYTAMVEAFVADSDYALICFNYGLHGQSVPIEEYEAAYRRLLTKFTACAKVVVSLTTVVHDKNDLTREKEECAVRVRKRNECAVSLAKEFGLVVDDAFTLSLELGGDGKQEDGVHFNGAGKEALGISKARAIKRALDIAD